MRIDEKELKLEFNKLLKDFYKVRSYTDYRLKIISALVLSQSYNELTGKTLDLSVPNIDYYDDKLILKPGYLDEILDEYFNNQREHNKLSGKIIGTFHRADFKDYNLEQGTSKISKKRQYELINEFLLDLNPNIHKEFNSLLMNKRIDSTQKYYETNATYFNYYKGNAYVMVDKLENIYDVDILMHELGHAYAIKRLENKSKVQSLNFTRSYHELISMYMELCFQDYLKKNHIYLKDAYLIENSFYTYMYYYFLSLKSVNNIKDDESLCINDMEFIEEAFIYAYGHYLAMRIHENSMKDREGTNEALNDFLSYQGLLSYDEQLNLFGLNRENLNDMKVLKKRLNTHKEEIKNYIKD